MSNTRPTRQQPHKLASPTRGYVQRSILGCSTSSGYGDPYDRRGREGVTRWTSGSRHRGRRGGGAEEGSPGFFGRGGGSGGAADVAVGWRSNLRRRNIGDRRCRSCRCGGNNYGFSADTGIFDEVSSSADIESTSLLNPTSFPSLVLATDNEVCDDAGEPACVGVSVVSVTLEDGTLEFVREAQATP
jgi:hypothetical protein